MLSIGKKHYLDEDNVVTRGVKKGANAAFFVKNNPRLIKGLRIAFVLLFIFLIVRWLF